MKYLFLMMLALGFALGTGANDALALDKAYLTLMASDVGAKKRAIITAHMKLTPAQEEVFWPIYEDYEEEMTRLAQSRLEVLQEYRAVARSLTEEMAGAMLLQFLDLEEKEHQIKRKYFKKLEKEFSALAAAKLFQVDDQINLMLRLELAASKLPIAR